MSYKELSKEDLKRYWEIGEVALILGIETSAIRYWEKEFPEFIKPHKHKRGLGSVRKYDLDGFTRVKVVHYLTKKRGMTIEGARMLLGLEGETLPEFDQALENYIYEFRTRD